MTTFQYILLFYVLLVFLVKALFHTLGALGGQKVTFKSEGHVPNFVLAVIDWSVIFALIGVLF